MAEQREIKVPPLGESVSEATIARWAKQPGEAVTMDEILVELETDKVTLEVTAPATGVLSDVKYPVGQNVQVGQILGLIEVGGVAQAQAPASQPVDIKIAPVTVGSPAPAVASVVPIQQAPQSTDHVQELSPSARKMVVENQLSSAQIQGTGKDGRVTKEDVIYHLDNPISTPSVQHAAAPVMSAVSSVATAAVMAPQSDPRLSEKREERVRMTRLRQKIAERLKNAQNTAAILTTFNEVDMTAINKIRAQYKESFEKKYGIKLGFMSFFVKAAIRALKEIPEVNAELSGEEIIYKNYYDIGVAVSAPQGLVVPVVRDADLLSFADVESQIAQLGSKARDGKLTIEDMTGGTFTVSNGGIFGSLMSTPILNSPQTGILGMHKVQDRPMAIDGKVEIRPMMYIALSYDHRLIDGKEAVTFLVRVKENIENPERLLLEI